MQLCRGSFKRPVLLKKIQNKCGVVILLIYFHHKSGMQVLYQPIIFVSSANRFLPVGNDPCSGSELIEGMKLGQFFNVGILFYFTRWRVASDQRFRILGDCNSFLFPYTKQLGCIWIIAASGVMFFSIHQEKSNLGKLNLPGIKGSSPKQQCQFPKIQGQLQECLVQLIWR